MTYDLFITAAKSLSEEMLLNELESAIQIYKVHPTKEAKQNLGLCSMMVGLRMGTEETSTSELINTFNKQDKILDTFENLDN